MASHPSWLRCAAALILAAGLLVTGVACKKSSSNPAGTVNCSGTVTYTRLPILYDGNGSPTGLGSTGTVLPARGVLVRAFQLYYDVNAADQAIPTWRLAGSTVTDSNGFYSLNGLVHSGYATFLEVASIFQQTSGDLASVEVVGDPNGIASTAAEPDRPIYVLREDGHGNTFSADPVANYGGVAVTGGDLGVNFNVGTGDTWELTVPNWYLSGSSPQGPSGTAAVGSRVLAILDSVYQFAYYYGDPTPSKSAGGVLDLHYYPGRTETPRRSYVMYDPAAGPLASDGTPLAFDGTKLHYFATLAGGGNFNNGATAGTVAVDDAYDPGVIYPMLGRNHLFGQGKTALFPTGRSDLSSLSPDLALVDGLGDAMAAILLKTPFLTDATQVTPLAPRDIRTSPASLGPVSAANLAAVAWQLDLDVFYPNAFNPLGPTQWANIDPSAMVRFFTITYPVQYYLGGTQQLQADVSSILQQVSRIQEAKQGGETYDLNAALPTLTIVPLVNEYDISWSGSQVGVGWTPVSTYWGEDPDSGAQALPAMTLSMANAQKIYNPDTVNATTQVYPNCSAGEVQYGLFALRQDRTYQLTLAKLVDSATGQADVPANAQVELVVDGDYQNPYLFPGTVNASAVTSLTALPSYNLTLRGNPTSQGNPLVHTVRVRLLSPAVQQPNIQATVGLTWVSVP